jgi:hypothetical protein
VFGGFSGCGVARFVKHDEPATCTISEILVLGMGESVKRKGQQVAISKQASNVIVNLLGYVIQAEALSIYEAIESNKQRYNTSRPNLASKAVLIQHVRLPDQKFFACSSSIISK